ncbi:MAG: trypsin-like peptidase domain-containing protein [Oscillospiraceae bacterium]|nr:trypsin-like peptidase domain-containing protein [Oscillospiraceae bacterium]
MSNEFHDENNLYHFSYRDPNAESHTESAAGSTVEPAADPVVTDTPVQPKKHHGGVGRVVALILSCAVISAACGFGGAILAQNGSRTGKTTVQQSNRTAATVNVKKVDGQTLMSPAEVYASTVNSVVSINCSAVSTNIFGQQTESASSGSGFIYTADGYIVTNQHVVANASSINVTLYNGDTYPATLVGSDSDYDVAVLKIDAKDLPAVTLGSSTDVNVGDTVMAIGNPLGELTFSMSQGIVSCVNRAINVEGTPFNMIQVDASINPGNSGGPLMNLYGEVVGIVSAKYSSYANTTVEGLGFAIPINDVQSIIKDIIENGSVGNKAYMAITAGTMTQQMAAQYKINATEGVFVYSVEDGGAGDKAGLKLGDVITKLNDTQITSMEDLSAAKKGFKAGDTVTLTVLRDGKEITTQLTFDAQPQTTDDTADSSQSGDNNYNNGNNGYNGNGYSDLYDYFFGRH